MHRCSGGHRIRLLYFHIAFFTQKVSIVRPDRLEQADSLLALSDRFGLVPERLRRRYAFERVADRADDHTIAGVFGAHLAHCSGNLGAALAAAAGALDVPGQQQVAQTLLRHFVDRLHGETGAAQLVAQGCEVKDHHARGTVAAQIQLRKLLRGVRKAHIGGDLIEAVLLSLERRSRDGGEPVF